jgi:hypothetical protein
VSLKIERAKEHTDLIGQHTTVAKLERNAGSLHFAIHK